MREKIMPLRLNLLTLLILSTLLILAPTVQAASISVGTGCTLAQAIEAANTDMVPTGSTCTAGAGADTITLSADITLTVGLPNIDSDVTIEGEGFSISGDDTYEIFVISSGTVTINNLTMTNGLTSFLRGGAIRLNNSGTTLTLNNSTVTETDSQNGGALALNAGTTATINNSVFSNNQSIASLQWGAAISVMGDGAALTINNSSITGNSRSDTTVEGGGAIYAQDNYTLNITRSYIANNTGSHYGGIRLQADHADIRATVTNTTIANNRSIETNGFGGTGAGIIVWDHIGGTFVFQHITLSNNTGSRNRAGNQLDTDGDISGAATNITLVNSIIDDANTNSQSFHGNDCAIGRGLSDNAGRIITIAGNLIADGGGTAGSYRCLPVAASGDPLLGELSSSPAPPHYVPGAGSPALRAASPEHCLPVDQLGRSRSAGFCDIGAIQVSQPPKKKEKEEPAAVLDPTVAPPQPSTCDNMGNGVSVSGVAGGNAPQCTDGVVANAEIAGAGGYIDAVDIWGWIGTGLEVCFDRAGGLVFLDAATSPRAIYQLTSYVGANGGTCAFIDRPGTVVLMNPATISPSWMPAPWEPPQVLAAAPAAEVAASPYQALSGCMVRTEFVLYFRAEPGGEPAVPETVPFNVTLTALERTADWFHVDYHGARGWISAAHVMPMGNCR